MGAKLNEMEWNVGQELIKRKERRFSSSGVLKGFSPYPVFENSEDVDREAVREEKRESERADEVEAKEREAKRVKSLGLFLFISIMSSPPKSTQDEGYQVSASPPPPAAPPKVDTSSLPQSTSSSSSSPILSPLSPTPNDKLAPLRALFPSTSDDILDAVLEAHSGDVNSSVEALLDMNNPEFKTDTAQQEEVNTLSHYSSIRGRS